MDFQEPYGILTHRLANWCEMVNDYLPRVIIALVVFVLFYIISSWAVRFFQRFIRGHIGSSTLGGLYAFFIKAIIIIFGLYCAAEIMDFDKVVISILAGAGIVGLIVGLAFQELLINFISGVSLSIKKNFHIGDKIGLKDYFGIVERLGLRATILRGRNNETIIIPNKDVIQSIVTNYYTSGMVSQELFIGILGTEDVVRVIEVLKEAISGLSYLHKDNQTEVLVVGFEGTIMKLVVKYTISYPNEQKVSRGDEHFSILSIRATFEKYKIPLPQYIRRQEFNKELVVVAH